MTNFDVMGTSSNFDANMNQIGSEIASLSSKSDPSEADVQDLVDDNKRWSLLTNLKADIHKNWFDTLNAILGTFH